MKIYTRAGDEGQTGLLYGDRVSKNSVLPEAYGTVDEVNAAIGVVLTNLLDEDISKVLSQIQNDLFLLSMIIGACSVA